MITPCVLIAESDGALIGVYSLFLKSHGYDVVTARDGLQCLDKVRNVHPDTVVLERGLPWGGGEGVLDCMREDYGLLSKTVVLIGDESPDELADLIVPPVVAAFQKPVRMRSLLRVLLAAGLPTAQRDVVEFAMPKRRMT